MLCETEKSKLHDRILTIRFSLGSKLHLQDRLNFLTKFAQKIVLPAENGKIEYHHRIHHIRISLDTQF